MRVHLARSAALVLWAVLACACTPRTVPADVPTGGVEAPAPTPPPASPPPADDVALPACTRDEDCAVKDVGSCCGYRPACVHRDTPTFPDEVRARCANEGRVGICGFPAIEGCRCVAGRCQAQPAGPAAPEPLQ